MISAKNKGIEKAIAIVGKQSALAEKCGVAQPAVSYWLYQLCPAERAIQIERITGISREEIRPDLFKEQR